MTNTEEEKLKEAYYSYDKSQKELSDKVNQSMIEIIKLEDSNDGFDVYKYIMQTFSKEELGLLGCIYIGKKMIDRLENDPLFKMACKTLKVLDKLDKEKEKEKE